MLRTSQECNFFFLNDPPTPEIYPLSLPDPLPIPNRTPFEAERVLVGEPSGELGLEFAAEVGANVEIGDAGSAAQPLQNAAAGEIHVEGLDVYGDSAQGLEGIEHNVGADLVGLFDDGRCIVDIRAAEDDV